MRPIAVKHDSPPSAHAPHPAHAAAGFESPRPALTARPHDRSSRLRLALLRILVPAGLGIALLSSAVASLAQPIAGQSLEIDDRGRLLVFDHVRGFLVGRFRAPAYMTGAESPEEGGIALENPRGLGPDLPAVALTSFRERLGFPIACSGPVAVSPCIADLEDDGRMETVVACTDGWIDLVTAIGAPVKGWPVKIEDEFYAPPCAIDLNGDRRLEIVTAGMSGKVYALERGGAQIPGWPVHPGSDAGLAAPFFAAPAAGDLNGDGAPEVCIVNAKGVVWVFGAGGASLPGWPQVLPSPEHGALQLASPALADLDGRPGFEVVIAGQAGRIYAWRFNGETLPGWPAVTSNLAPAGTADPAIGDIDGDRHPDIVVACAPTSGEPARIAAFDAGGRPLRGWPCELPEECNGGVALANLAGDVAAEVAVATIGGNASLLLLDGRTARPLPGWPKHFSDQTINAVPLIADLDGDAALDICVATISTGREIHAWLWAADAEGRELRAFPIFLPYEEIVRATPAASDLDGDGNLELVCATEVSDNLHAWELEAICEPGSLPWPAQGAGPARQGALADAALETPLVKEARTEGPSAPSFDTSSLPPEIAGEGTSLDPGSARADEVQAPATRPREAEAGIFPTIPFTLERDTPVRLIVFNIQGTSLRKLLDHRLPAGRYEIFWDGRDENGRPQASGIYFYQLVLGDRSATRQLLLLK